MATRVTAPVPSQRSPFRRTATTSRPRFGMPLQQAAALVVALVILLGVSAPLLGSRIGMLAFEVGINQNAGSSVSMMPTGSRASAAAIATPLPKIPMPPEPTGTPAGPYSNLTPPPGYTSFAVQDFPDDYWATSFGQCTWWAHYKRADENLNWMGDAWNWANAARRRGLTVTTTAAPNATVVFAPNVQEASTLGHVAHVEKLLTDGWVLISEMNFFWNGGGNARVDYRYIHTGDGVWFIH
jgi:surface antigen